MELKQNSKPYIQFWESWIKSDSCFLNETEIKIIERYVFKDFDLGGTMLLAFKLKNQLSIIEKLNEKLKIEFIKYKDWVIFSFLCGIIKIAENGGKKQFMETPINELDILNEIKIEFRKLHVNTIQDFFVKYSEDDLYKPEIFQSISEIKGHLSSKKVELNS